MGAKIGEMQDGVVIEGKGSLCGAELDGKGNLPLSLGLLLASLLAEGESKLVNHQKISEHYPSLFGLLDLVCCFAN
jgi:3-phosphoshikimate 1-carboxyvinyltransferase